MLVGLDGYGANVHRDLLPGACQVAGGERVFKLADRALGALGQVGEELGHVHLRRRTRCLSGGGELLKLGGRQASGERRRCAERAGCNSIRQVGDFRLQLRDALGMVGRLGLTGAHGATVAPAYLLDDDRRAQIALDVNAPPLKLREARREVPEHEPVEFDPNITNAFTATRDCEREEQARGQVDLEHTRRSPGAFRP